MMAIEPERADCGGSFARSAFVGLVATAVVGVACSASKPAQTPTGQTASASPATTAPALANAKTVHCAEPTSTCFDAAKTLCRGPWHQVAEPGDAFPAMIGEGNGRYRMTFGCGEDAK